MGHLLVVTQKNGGAAPHVSPESGPKVSGELQRGVRSMARAFLFFSLFSFYQLGCDLIATRDVR